MLAATTVLNTKIREAKNKIPDVNGAPLTRKRIIISLQMKCLKRK